MAKWFGWAGNILDVNLTTGSITKKRLPRDLASKYIGGSGLGARILFDELSPRINPLGPENIIVVGQGPLSGTAAPSCGRYQLVMKSPLTNLINRSNGGGFFGPELKWAGLDIIIIRGRSASPVYLWINDGDAEIREAGHLWGRDTWSTHRLICEELGDEAVKTLKIGPAGEKLSYLACVIGDLSRAAGRYATGTVWGSKNLKAIAVRGSRGVNIARPAEFMALCQALSERAKKDPLYGLFSRYGTLATVSDPRLLARGMLERQGADRAKSGLLRLLSTEFEKEVFEKNLACFGCDLHCSHYYKVRSGPYAGVAGEGPEATSVTAGGTAVGVMDPDFVCKYNNDCNQLGLDASKAGRTIGWAMQLYSDGIITRQDTDGIDLTWGNQASILQMLYKIAAKEGFGGVIDGSPPQIVEKLGSRCEPYISHTKGTLTEGHGIWQSASFALAEAISTRGRDHLVGAPFVTTRGRYPKEITDDTLRRVGDERFHDAAVFLAPWNADPIKARYVYEHENAMALHDMTGTCKFRGEHMLYAEGIHPEDMANLLSAATGVEFTLKDVIQAGEREMLLERAFNAREGIRRIDDYPHAFHWLLKNGKPHPRYDYAALPIDLKAYDRLLDEYYRLRGCDLQTGIPTRKKLEEVGLADVADKLDDV